MYLYGFVIVILGLDWCLVATKGQIRDGIRKMVRAIRQKNNFAVIGISGITHGFTDYDTTKIQTIKFNRTTRLEVADLYAEAYLVQFLYLHLHFLDVNYNSIQPVHHYFDQNMDLTVVGAMVLRQMILKEIGVIPMDEAH